VTHSPQCARSACRFARYGPGVRSVELAIYADSLAAEAAALAARVEQTRSRLRQAAIEEEAAAALPPQVVGRLRALGLLLGGSVADGPAELARLGLDLEAVLKLQSWVERQLRSARDGAVPALREVS
jgi:hypothetical protein